MTASDPTYYPVYLQLEGYDCVVIGGGKIAEGKVEGLLSAGARITIVSPELTERLQALVTTGKLTHFSRCYQSGDLAGAFLVICATNRPSVNHQVWLDATADHRLVNVVDDIPRCNFILPSTVRQGDLMIAISTSGKAPALAIRIKEYLQQEIGPHYAHFLRLAGKLRQPLAEHFPDIKIRKTLWYDLVDSDVLALLEAGNEAAALQRITEIVGFPFRPDML